MGLFDFFGVKKSTGFPVGSSVWPFLGLSDLCQITDEPTDPQDAAEEKG